MARLIIMAVLVLVSYAVVESKPRYPSYDPYADRDPVVNDPAKREIHRTVQQLLQAICLYQCRATNKVVEPDYKCEQGCGLKAGRYF